jgi:hypothetical protein
VMGLGCHLVFDQMLLSSGNQDILTLSYQIKLTKALCKDRMKQSLSLSMEAEKQRARPKSLRMQKTSQDDKPTPS